MNHSGKKATYVVIGNVCTMYSEECFVYCKCRDTRPWESVLTILMKSAIFCLGGTNRVILFPQAFKRRSGLWEYANGI